MFVTNTELLRDGNGMHVACYWMGDKDNDRICGICFPGESFNIARQSLAESMATANDILTDLVDETEPN